MTTDPESTADSETATVTATIPQDTQSELDQGKERWVAVYALDRSEVLRCRADRIEESSLALTVPAECGLSVGHRYEICVLPDCDPGNSQMKVAEGQYATVTETQPQAGDLQGRMAVGMRFDQPFIP